MLPAEAAKLHFRYKWTKRKRLILLMLNSLEYIILNYEGIRVGTTPKSQKKNTKYRIKLFFYSPNCVTGVRHASLTYSIINSI